MSVQKKFRHIGGGCLVHSGRQYPCDDQYESRNEVIIVKSTKDAHFSMPERVRDASCLKRRKGVKSVKVYDKKKYYGEHKLYEGMN